VLNFKRLTDEFNSALIVKIHRIKLSNFQKLSFIVKFDVCIDVIKNRKNFDSIKKNIMFYDQIY
jgi:hypothetical protein